MPAIFLVLLFDFDVFMGFETGEQYILHEKLGYKRTLEKRKIKSSEGGIKKYINVVQPDSTVDVMFNKKKILI